MPTYFNGQTLIQPQVVSAIDDSALAAANTALGSATVGVVGPSTGGVPNTALSFTRATDAAAVLRSGALLDVIRRVFDPGAGTPGAPRVVAVRIATPVRSTLTLQDTAPANCMVLTSVDYGAWTNQIRVTVAAGTTQGKKITIAAPDRVGNTGTIIGDNIYRASFSVFYSAQTGNPATMTISSTQITTSCTGAPGDQVTLTFAQYPTLQQIVDAFNATGKYAAAVLASPSDASNKLDGATTIDIRTATYNATSTLQACIDFVNTTPYITAVRSTGILPPATLTTTYLASGSDGSAPSNSDYSAGLVILEGQDTGIVCVASGTAAVHAFANTHVNNMSGITGKKERIAVVGGVFGETVAQAVARAASLGSQRVGIVYPGFKDLDPDTSILTNYDPFVAAGTVAGVLAGGSVADAATNDRIGATSLEAILSDSNIDTCLVSGVIPLKLLPGKGFRVAQSISTWTADSNYAHVELSVRRNADYVNRTVRESLIEIVGRASGPSLLALVSSRVNSTLRQLEFDGYVVGTPTQPAFKNIQVTASGATVSVQYTASVSIPANYITLTAHVAGFTATS